MATLTSTKIKNTYDALLKATDNDAIGSSAKQITDGLGNGTPLYISTTQIGIGVTPEATYDLHVYSNAKVGGNLTVTGDLTVEGTTTTIDTQTLTVEDPLIEVASNNTSTDAVDIGWYGKYAPSGTTLYAGLFRDTGDSKFKLFRNLQEQPTTTVNTSGTGYTVATLVADLEGTLTGVIASTTTATTQSANDNSTKVATTAYVDNQVTLQDLDFAGDSGTGAVDLDSQTLSITGGTLITTTALNQNLDIDHNSVSRTDTTSSASPAFGGTFTAVDSVTSSTEGHITAINLKTVTVPTPTYPTVNNNTITINAGSNLDTGGAFTLNQSFDETITIDLATTITGLTSVSSTTFSGQLDGTISSTTTATTQTQGDNSTKVATTAYVDSAIGGQDTLAEILANGNTTGGTDIAVSSGDSITFAGSGSTSTVINHSTYDTRIINDNSLGSIILRSADTVMQNAAGTETIAHFYENGAVELYYDNSKKFETTNTGVQVTGTANSNALYLYEGDFTMHGGSSGQNDIRWINTWGNWRIEVGDGANNFKIHSESLAADYLTLEGGGQLNLGEYGSGSFTGTATYRLAVDSSGDVIEIPIGGGAVDGSGTANTVTMWSDTDTITDAPITISGNNATFAGNVGIGKTPSTWKLDVDSSDVYAASFDTSNNVGIVINGNNTTAAQIIGYSNSASTYNELHLRTNSTTTDGLYIDSSGNVGIGYTSPSSFNQRVNAPHLVVGSGSNSAGVTIFSGTASQGSINFADGTTTTDQYTGGIVYVHGSDNYMSFHTNGGTERMRIDSSGLTRFTVDSGTASAIDIGYVSSARTIRAVETGGGNARPLTLLAQNFTFKDDSATRMVIDSSGSVGIGTTSPDSGKLDVQSSGSWGQYGRGSTADINVENTNTSVTEGGWIGISGYTGNTANSGYYPMAGITAKKSTTAGDGNYGGDLSFWTTAGTGQSGEANSGMYQRMTINRFGNVGIGTISPFNTLDVRHGTNNRAVFSDSSSYGDNVLIGLNDSGGEIGFGIAGSSLSFYTNVTERMRIDSSGNVGIGTGGAGARNARLLLQNAGSSGAPQLMLVDSNSSGQQAEIRFDAGNLIYEHWNGSSRSEKMRIIDTGYIKARGRNTTAYEYPTNTFHSLEANESNEPTLVLFNDTTSNAYGLNVINGTDHNNTTSRFFLGQGGSTERIKIFSNGNVANTNNSYTALSDIKLKENITDATPKLNDLMQVKIRNYNLIGEELKQIGVVAQELEEVFPALVYETPDTERQDINKTDEEGNIIYQTEEVLVSEAVEGQEAIEWEDKPTIDNTKVEIQTWLDENSIEWQSADTKQELLDRIPEYQQEAVEAQDAVYETRETDIPETVNKEVDLGTTTKAVKYSVFVPMLIKAMQEQQEIINDLKARIEALEN